MSVALVLAAALMGQSSPVHVAEGPTDCARQSQVEREMIDERFEVFCFVGWIYGPGVMETITPLGRDAPRIFTRATVAEMQAARARAPEGESHPAFEADPVCDCQDPGGLRLISLVVPEAEDDHAVARILFDFGAGTVDMPPPDQMREHILILEREADGWRIDDIINGAGWSFRRSLAD